MSARLDRILSKGSTTVEPWIACEDGFSVSVQASPAHYATDSSGLGRFSIPPRRSMVGPILAAEVGYPSEQPEPWRCAEWSAGFDRHGEHTICDGWEVYAEDPTNPTSTVYAYVPAQMIRDLIASHGGEATR